MFSHKRDTQESRIRGNQGQIEKLAQRVGYLEGRLKGINHYIEAKVKAEALAMSKEAAAKSD